MVAVKTKAVVKSVKTSKPKTSVKAKQNNSMVNTIETDRRMAVAYQTNLRGYLEDVILRCSDAAKNANPKANKTLALKRRLSNHRKTLAFCKRNKIQ